MNRRSMQHTLLTLLCLTLWTGGLTAQNNGASNPLIWADVPDMSMIRVGDTYYMSSTTMHMSPGVPIMKSEDLSNWELIGYAYDTLADIGALNLENGQDAYGKGSWASCLVYHDGTFYVTTFASTTGRTHVYRTDDIEGGTWKANSFAPSHHDHTMFFDDDGKVYMIWGNGKLFIKEMKPDLSGPVDGAEDQVLIANASAPAGDNIMLGAEGSQLFKHDGKYYLFDITWPRGGMRTVVIHRADNIMGPWEGRVALQDRGIAQGGLIDTPDGDWYAYLFRDNGGVGRIPYLTPVTWADGWPVLGTDGKVPDTLDLPVNGSLMPGLVQSDEFARSADDRALPLAWQWNHNPDDTHWSLTDRPGYLRLTAGRVDTSFVEARNTLTQRTFGPTSTATTKLDVSGMQDGDFAGLSLLQKNYGLLGVKAEGGEKRLVMVRATETGGSEEVASVPLTEQEVYLRASCDFRDRADTGQFYYSLNGEEWTALGEALPMPYTLPHFMGYRFGLFNYATEAAGGYADFDFYHVDDQLQTKK